jgi:hypothetical protein
MRSVSGGSVSSRSGMPPTGNFARPLPASEAPNVDHLALLIGLGGEYGVVELTDDGGRYPDTVSVLTGDPKRALPSAHRRPYR